MPTERSCPNCGSVSNDPDWCQVCGADLSTAATPAWLQVGDCFEIPLTSSTRPSARDAELLAGDTLVPPDETGTDIFTREATDVNRVADAFDVSGVPAAGPRQSTLINAPMPALADLTGPRTVTVTSLTIREVVTELPSRHVFIAQADSGESFRVEQKLGRSQEAIPDAARPLAWLLDLPLGAIEKNGFELKAYRLVNGQTLHERLEARTEPLTPTEVVEWLRPIARALAVIHHAGFLCLRLCPYTVKYAPSGDVFLQGVEVLYPRDQPLAKLPAIAGYAAPEIYAASLESPPTPAADIYSLAMIAYFLIARADPPASVYTSHTPVILARDFSPDFPLGFAPVLAAAGALSPDSRPADAEAFINLVEAARERSVRQIPTATPLRLGVAADTHIGVVKRLQNPVNQDAVFAATDPAGTTALLVVADGVSTATFGSGDLASSVARACAAQAWRTYQANPETVRERGVGQWLRDLLERMNTGVVDAVNEAYAPFDGEPSEVMGSTCVLAFVQAGIATVAAIGDSRAYLCRRGYMEQITRDHNLLTLGIASGLDPDTALMLPQGDALARCLGAFDLDGGRLVPTSLEPDVYVFPLLPGDRLLLCSDGLTDYAGDTLDDAERAIFEAAMGAELADLACLDLIRLANGGGGGDNIGVALCVADPTWLGPFDWFTELRTAAEERLGY
ncbi:MAG: protein phosphatase 2C domain-containing protein [Myxococcales bacterium]|nr:protein phosphatase 2C domain-containing protein [Myxococcales bacterium]MCB9534383.1 protein phosphatase 2C domain-containing protein [Myxococcales bacterium]